MLRIHLHQSPPVHCAGHARGRPGIIPAARQGVQPGAHGASTHERPGDAGTGLPEARVPGLEGLGQLSSGVRRGRRIPGAPFTGRGAPDHRALGPRSRCDHRGPSDGRDLDADGTQSAWRSPGHDQWGWWPRRCRHRSPREPFRGVEEGGSAMPATTPCDTSSPMPCHFPRLPLDDRNLPDMHFGLYRDLLIFDHVDKLLYLVVHVAVSEHESPEAAWDAGQEALEALDRMVQAAQRAAARRGHRSRTGLRPCGSGQIEHVAFGVRIRGPNGARNTSGPETPSRSSRRSGSSGRRRRIHSPSTGRFESSTPVRT